MAIPEILKNYYLNRMKADLNQDKFRRNPDVLGLDRGIQDRKQGLADRAQLASGLSEASSLVGGTQMGRTLPTEAARLNKIADTGAANVMDKRQQLFNPKIYEHLIGKPKKSGKPMNYTDQYGVKRVGNYDYETKSLQKAPNDATIEVPNREDTIDKLSKSYNKQIKAIKGTADAYTRLQSLIEEARGKEGTGGLDHAIIKSFEKLLDPDSVVREGEFAQVASIGSAMDRFVKTVEKFEVGSTLTDNMRRQLSEAMDVIYRASLESAKGLDERWRLRAEPYKEFGVDFDSQIKTNLPKIKEKSADTVTTKDIDAMSIEELQKYIEQGEQLKKERGIE